MVMDEKDEGFVTSSESNQPLNLSPAGGIAPHRLRHPQVKHGGEVVKAASTFQRAPRRGLALITSPLHAMHGAAC